MPHTSSPLSGPPKLSNLLPKRITKFLGERPTLPFESDDDFDALHAELVVSLDPKDFMEDVWVGEIAHAQWDIIRMRDWRRAAIENNLPDAALQMMRPELNQAVHDDKADLQEEATHIVRCAARGSAPHQKFFNSILAKAKVTHNMLNVEAYRISLPTISALDEAIAKAERRRDQILREMEQRRQLMAAMKRVNGGPPARVVDIDPKDNAA